MFDLYFEQFESKKSIKKIIYELNINIKFNIHIDIFINVLYNNDMKEKYNGIIHIVYDGMWGSCGKGKFCGELALNPKLNIQVCVNNNAPNAGHSFVFDDGRKIITKHIPIGFVNKHIPYLVIGESAVIDYDRLVYEIETYKDLLDRRKIYIADTAAVILDKHKQEEIDSIKSGSTFSGAGAALVDKIMRKNSLVCNDERFLKLEKEGFIKIVNSKTFFPMIYNALSPFDGSENILVELSQGDALGLNNSANYPNTTSRDCSPAQALKDIHATDLSSHVRKYCVFRPYPIRINNNSKAGYIYTGDFEGAKEISWEEVCKRCNLSSDEVKILEHTTVTKRLRRVSEFSIKQFAEMLLDTRPDECFLNFAEYINGYIIDMTDKEAKEVQRKFRNCSDLSSKSEEKLTEISIKNYAIENILGYIKDIETYFNDLLGFNVVNITKIGTGAKLSQTIERKNVAQIADVRHAIKSINPFDFADKQNAPSLEL